MVSLSGKEARPTEDPNRKDLMGQLADWKCHKVVKAGKILDLDVAAPTIIIEDVNGAECKVARPQGFGNRGWPSRGDYLVIYEDGYKSWSPAKAFEDGYTRVVAGAPTELERLRGVISGRLEAHLVEMREGYDDSITGFNEAWDIVRKVFEGWKG